MLSWPAVPPHRSGVCSYKSKHSPHIYLKLSVRLLIKPKPTPTSPPVFLFIYTPYSPWHFLSFSYFQIGIPLFFSLLHLCQSAPLRSLWNSLFECFFLQEVFCSCVIHLSQHAVLWATDWWGQGLWILNWIRRQSFKSCAPRREPDSFFHFSKRTLTFHIWLPNFHVITFKWHWNAGTTITSWHWATFCL